MTARRKKESDAAKTNTNPDNDMSEQIKRMNLSRDRVYVSNKLSEELYNYHTDREIGGTEYLYQKHADYFVKKEQHEETVPPFEIEAKHLSGELRKELVKFKSDYGSSELTKLLLTCVGHLFELKTLIKIKPILWVRIDGILNDQEDKEFGALLGDYKPDIQDEKRTLTTSDENVGGDDGESKEFDEGGKVKKYKAYDELDEHIKGELEEFTYFIINREPAKFYVANHYFNQIIRGFPGKQTVYEDGEPAGVIDKLRFSMPIINAVPISVIKYNNELETDKKYRITFKSYTGEVFTTAINTIENTIKELRGRGMIAFHREAEAALAGILLTMEDHGKVEITHNVEAPGFYPIDGKIVCYGLEFKTPKNSDLIECCEFMNDLVEKYRKKDGKGNIIKDRRILPATTIKWAIPAPFDYVMKKIYHRFIPWLQLCGYPSTAKNTVLRYALAVWRIQDKSQYNVPFTNANSEARLGYHISQTTLPVGINEVTTLNDPRNANLVNMMKNAVEDVNARGKYDKNNKYNNIPSLSAVLLTGNGVPPRDAGFRTKIPPVIFTDKDIFNRESKEAMDFEKWLNPKIHLLGTLGDFAQNYIINKPEVLCDKTWDEIAVEVLSELYASAKLDIPDWINLTIERKGLEQTTDEVILILRGYFINLINDTCNRYRPPTTIDEDGREFRDSFIDPNMALIDKLKTCCDKHLISFIHKGEDKKLGKVLYITLEIMRDLERNRLGDMVSTLEGLASVLKFDYKPVRVEVGDVKKPMKVIVASEEKMKRFLEYNITEEPELTPPPTPTPTPKKEKAK